jgi:hypothetical protein
MKVRYSIHYVFVDNDNKVVESGSSPYDVDNDTDALNYFTQQAIPNLREKGQSKDLTLKEFKLLKEVTLFDQTSKRHIPVSALT